MNATLARFYDFIAVVVTVDHAGTYARDAPSSYVPDIESLGGKKKKPQTGKKNSRSLKNR